MTARIIVALSVTGNSKTHMQSVFTYPTIHLCSGCLVRVTLWLIQCNVFLAVSIVPVREKGRNATVRSRVSDACILAAPSGPAQALDGETYNVGREFIFYPSVNGIDYNRE